ncbi:hypothetical protein A1D29_03295 [Pasteurellaceae bacterium Orientalotternb1]|nr:hypothetical protein A1D29_03295 [Pasteurellaceae bacterium Orientalotternb1]
MKPHYLLFSMLLGLSSPLFAQTTPTKEELNEQLQQAMQLLTDSSNSQQGILLLEQVANENYADAQLWLGDNYFYGIYPETPKDYLKAIYWYEKAAEQQSYFAMEKLAEIYEKGLGVSVDLTKAFELHKKAYELAGYANDSSLYVAKAYLNGIGVEKDLQQAVTYLQKNAEAYSAEANILLGKLYETGEGVEQSDSKAFECYSRIGKSTLFQNNSENSYRLAKMYAEGRGTERNLEQASAYYIDVIKYGSQTLKQEAKTELTSLIPEITQLAETDEIYQLLLGSLYEDGFGVPKDVYKADSLYKTLYQNSEDTYVSGEAFTLLDHLRKRATGVQRPVHIINPTEADKTALLQIQSAIGQGEKELVCKLLPPLAEKGWAEAQYTLANLDDFPCMPNPTKAFELMQKAAQQQHTLAMVTLADLYQTGFGVEQDWWFASYWYQQAANKGDVESLFQLAHRYEEGMGVFRDPQKAAELYQQAIDKGHIDSHTNLGHLYVNGTLGEPDYAKALSLFNIAAEQGDALAMFNLGVMYLDAHGVEQDYQQARYWLEKAEENGDANSFALLAEIYQTGKGVKKDLKKAFEYYMEAADNGSIDALYAIARAYEKGEGTTQDLEQAKAFYRLVIASGEPEFAEPAQIALDKLNKNSKK